MKKIILTIILDLAWISVFANIDLEKLTGRYWLYDIVSYTDKLVGSFKVRSLIISYGYTDIYIEEGKLMSKDGFCFSEYKANLATKTSSLDELTWP